jgi:tetratricopeptide (TPR) repeat protein
MPNDTPPGAPRRLEARARAAGATIAAATLVAAARILTVPSVATASQQADPVAFVNVHVVTMESEEPLRNRTVLVEGGRITWIGPADEAALPQDATTIDGKGLFLMPGLIDLHVHVPDTTVFPLFLAHGVTSVQHLNAGPSSLGWAERLAAGALQGPRLFPCEGPVSGLRDPAAAVAVVSAADSAGFDCVKIYGDISAEALTALADEGRRRGVRTVSHIPRNLTWQEMLAARPNAVAHAEEFLYSPIRHMADVDSIVAGMASGGIGLITTLVNYDYISRQPVMLEALQRDEHLELYPAVERRAWDAGRNRYVRDFEPGRVPTLRRRLGFQARLVELLAEGGATILLGTDAGNNFVLPGISAHEELERLTSAGLSPYGALAAATRDAAEHLGQGERLGTVAVGKSADLVLLYDDPLENVRHTRLIAGVMADGRWMDRGALEARLALLETDLAPEAELVRRVEADGVEPALRWLEGAWQEHPGRPLVRPRALNELGYQLWRIEDRLPRALRVFEANARLHSDWWAAHGSLGEAYEVVGRADDAVAAYRRAVELNPDAAYEAERIRALTGG